MLCQRCHKREATVHITEIAGEVMAKRDLCTECAPSDVYSEIIEQRCHYCCGDFACTAPDVTAKDERSQKLWGLCSRCAREFYGYWERKLKTKDFSKFTPEQFSEARRVFAELDEHMKEWIKRRGHETV